LTVKNDCSLFAFGSHNKKRPDNLVLGRTFDGHVLDMVEFGVRNFRPVESFKDAVAKRMGSKPAMVFTGDAWDNIEILGRLRNLLIDFFRGDVVDDICLAGLDHVMVVTAPDVPAGDVPGQAAVGSSILLHLRHYHIAFTKSAGGGAPSVELHPIGPAMDLAVRRSKLASPDLWKAALKKAKQNVTKKVKNISSSEMGDKLGRIHLGRQDLSSMQVRRVKALREPRGKRKAEDEAGADSGSDDED
jgi:ribosome production factor 2